MTAKGVIPDAFRHAQTLGRSPSFASYEVNQKFARAAKFDWPVGI